ncbi:hypothetical protein [Priestia megaterium]|uniref:hypothetical protein n=1 Tax=Priestia megaterium TaxID=1404 RepID=UPI0006FDC945|nr:hypothetical protein [Priestia megaterium]KQU25083.1 hypothetical protein ASG61_19010 [Bacillus sp. Leaf75]MEB2294536.1 hypothetical protein [Priestia megaterium]
MKIKLFFLMLLTFTFLISCSNQKATKEPYSDIKLELIKEQKLDKGISYEIKLINNSNAVLKQNNVYVYYPIEKRENVYGNNPYKVEAEGNKLDIKPGEKVTLNVFMPLQGIQNQSNIETKKPVIQLKGYLDEVNNENRFSIGGDLHKD